MKLKLYCLLLMICSSFAALAQKTVTGKVTKENGDPLSGATVTIKGTKTAASTKADGSFTIQVPSNSTKLVVTYIGTTQQEITVGAQTTLNIVQREESSTLNDVVVIGYQTVKRKDVLASVSSVGAKELKDIPINNAAEALNGRLAGVTATTSEGSPDADVKVRVRGGMSITQDNSPLYIVDGVQVENGLSSLAPQDIQSIDVLKDAAATAIYGARGANGVIVITTKTAKPGKLRVTYNALYGIKHLARKLDVMDPYQFVEFQWERSHLGRSSDTNAYGSYFDTLAVYKKVSEVDWQDEVMNVPNAHLMTHNVTLGGGNKKGTYNASYTFNDDKAIVINSRYKRHVLNLKGDYNFTKKLKVTLGGRYTTTNTLGAGISDESSGSSFSRLRNAVKYRPFLSGDQDIDEPDPLSPTGVGNGLSLTNPISLANAEYRNKNINAYNITASASYKFTKKLTFKTTFGYDINKTEDIAFYDSISPLAVSQGGSKPFIIVDTTSRHVITNSNVLTYDMKGFRKNHDLNFLLGQETYQLENFSHGRSIRGFASGTNKDQAFENQGQGIVIGTPKYFKSKYTNVSFFTRISYSFKDKYLLSFNMRADGASKFKPGNQWGYFPAGSFAWRVKKEKFLENVEFINDLKLRFGMGSVGNNRIGDYLFLTKFSSTDFYYGLGNQTNPAYTSTSLVNERLKWESTINRNLGVDITLFKNRIDLSVDIYKNSSKDLLLDVPIAATFGYTTQQQNVGETSNKGIEVQLNTTILRKKNNLNWTANFNISANKNKVVSLGYQTTLPASRSWGISGQPKDYNTQVGYPIGQMYGWVTDGFFTTADFRDSSGVFLLKPGTVDMFAISGGTFPGGIRFKDISGPNGVPDGIVDNFDRTVIGDPTPKFTGGLNQQFTYKGWDMSVFVNFSVGGDVFNANKIEFTNAYSANANLLDVMNGRWRTIDAQGNQLQRTVSINGRVYGTSTNPTALAELNKNATIWQPISGQNAFYPHSWAIEDGSFLRLNNITIGYSLPVKTMAKLHMSKLRFYLTGNNLAIITNYTGFDPEVSVRKSGLTPNLDYSAYPKSKSFIFGLNAAF